MNMDLCEIVRIDKRNSINMLITYKLYVSKSEEGEIYSLSVEKAGECSCAEDVCRDRIRAEDFLYLLAKEELEPCHLTDVLYDMLPL